MSRCVTRNVLLTVAAALLACAEQPAPGYTRVGGPAPAVVPAGPPATLVVFWATWCPPCREEVGSLRALGRDPPRGLSLVTFGVDEPEAAVRDFFGGEVPPELGYRPDVDHRATRELGVDVLPAAFLVAHGRLVARFSGPRDWDSRAMRRLLERLVSERQAGRSDARPDRNLTASAKPT
jgi:thioredoxin-like negative regulator of GroEL